MIKSLTQPIAIARHPTRSAIARRGDQAETINTGPQAGKTVFRRGISVRRGLGVYSAVQRIAKGISATVRRGRPGQRSAASAWATSSGQTRQPHLVFQCTPSGNRPTSAHATSRIRYFALHRAQVDEGAQARAAAIEEEGRSRRQGRQQLSRLEDSCARHEQEQDELRPSARKKEERGPARVRRGNRRGRAGDAALLPSSTALPRSRSRSPDGESCPPQAKGCKEARAR